MVVHMHHPSLNRKIVVQGSLCINSKTLFEKYLEKRGLEWLRCKALSAKPNTKNKNCLLHTNEVTPEWEPIGRFRVGFGYQKSQDVIRGLVLSGPAPNFQ
jgi:hypothetical protein